MLGVFAVVSALCKALVTHLHLMQGFLKDLSMPHSARDSQPLLARLRVAILFYFKLVQEL
jgi:hypothetical protein